MVGYSPCTYLSSLLVLWQNYVNSSHWNACLLVQLSENSVSCATIASSTASFLKDIVFLWRPKRSRSSTPRLSRIKHVFLPINSYCGRVEKKNDLKQMSYFLYNLFTWYIQSTNSALTSLCIRPNFLLFSRLHGYGCHRTNHRNSQCINVCCV